MPGGDRPEKSFFASVPGFLWSGARGLFHRGRSWCRSVCLRCSPGAPAFRRGHCRTRSKRPRRRWSGSMLYTSYGQRKRSCHGPPVGWVETNLPNIRIFCTDVCLSSTIRHKKWTSIRMSGRLVSFHCMLHGSNTSIISYGCNCQVYLVDNMWPWG